MQKFQEILWICLPWIETKWLPSKETNASKLGSSAILAVEYSLEDFLAILAMENPCEDILAFLAMENTQKVFNHSKHGRPP